MRFIKNLFQALCAICRILGRIKTERKVDHLFERFTGKKFPRSKPYVTTGQLVTLALLKPFGLDAKYATGKLGWEKEQDHFSNDPNRYHFHIPGSAVVYQRDYS